MKQLLRLMFLSFCIPLIACGGGGGGSDGPTAPPAQRSTLLLNAALVSLAGGMEEGSFRLDGREVFRATCNPGAACQMTATVMDVPRGAHAVSITVIRQTRASVTYIVVGQADFADGAGTRSIPLEQRSVTLRAGETITYNISI